MDIKGNAKLTKLNKKPKKNIKKKACKKPLFVPGKGQKAAWKKLLKLRKGNMIYFVG